MKINLNTTNEGEPLEKRLKKQTSDASQTNLRTFRRIPIFIVDYHHEVLEFLYRCFASRHLPLENNTLVHFDSHPDMVISREIPASSSYDRDTMLSELSIENWIMPGCYAGHFNRIVWLKNSWCQQMPVGTYNFNIGDKDDKIKVDCPLPYFLSEGNYCSTKELQHIKALELQIVDTDDSKKPFNAAEFLNKNEGFILDIDLDYFSTANPFLEIYKNANCYEQLKEIFNFENSSTEYVEIAKKRQKQLEVLKIFFEHLEKERSLDGFVNPDQNVISDDEYKKIKLLEQNLKESYKDDEIDWLLIYDSGCTTDNDGLPHHISSEQELELYLSTFKIFLQQLPKPPTAITIACSSEDDYCPKTQVREIEQKVLNILKEAFGEKLHENPILYYKDEHWDIMRL